MKGFAAFWRFIMNSLTYVLNITAIALNTYFSAWLLLFVCSGYGGHPLSLYACLSSILICAVPPVTLITIALTFHKNLKILNSVLRIIAIISRRPASSVFSPGLRPGVPLFLAPFSGRGCLIFLSTFTQPETAITCEEKECFDANCSFG